MMSFHERHGILILRQLGLLLFLSMTGCSTFRAPTNHSLWRAKLPAKPGFKDVVFILDSPPTAEFVFLLAQKYPESYVICSPKQGAWYNLYLNHETLINEKGPRLSPNDKIVRKISGFKPVELSAAPVSVGKYLIFHRMRMISAQNLPEPMTDSPCLRLSWSKIGQQNYLPSLPMPLQCLIIYPSYLTGGILWPPPLPRDYIDIDGIEGKQFLDIEINSKKKIHIVASDLAEIEFISGYIFLLPLSPFIDHTLPADGGEFIASNGHSPGGWANCLEQMVRNPDVKSVSFAANNLVATSREKAFDQIYNVEGYDLEPVHSAYQYSINRHFLYLFPRNPLLNLYMGESAFLIGVKFGRFYSPNTCFFKKHQDPFGLTYSWYKYENEKNWLAPALDSYYDRVKKAK